MKEQSNQLGDKERVCVWDAIWAVILDRITTTKSVCCMCGSDGDVHVECIGKENKLWPW